MWEVFVTDLSVEKQKNVHKNINREKPCCARAYGCFPQVEGPTTITTKSI